MKKIILAGFLIAFAASLFAQQRVVLIEQFSNASCPTCATYSPQVYNFANQNPEKVVVVTYHAPFPYQHDSFHFANPDDANARINYYNIHGTPSTVIDGNFKQGTTASLLNTFAADVNQRTQVAAKYNITIKNLRIDNGKVAGTAVYTSIGDNSAANLRAFVVLVEKSIPKSAYKVSPGSNAETEYKNVMRYLFPATDGKTIFNRADGDKDSIEFSLITPNVKSIEQVRIVAFVQESTTKEIYQAAYQDLQSTPTNTTQAEKPTATWGYNPSEKNYRVSFSTTIQGTITLTDITGRQVLQQTANGADALVDVSGLQSGLYIATVANGQTQTTTKIWVQ
jgi:thiol-disulfide isomerase/thioredoxin